VARTLTLDTPEQFHALGDPTRWAILGVLTDGPASIQELSRRLGIAKGTIGHHVKVLETAALVHVAETERVRGVTEKRYARAAHKFSFGTSGRELAQKAGDSQPLITLPLRQAVAEAAPGDDLGEEEDATSSFIFRSRMTPGRARRFVRMLEAIGEEFAAAPEPHGETFGIVAAVYRPAWSLPTSHRGSRPTPLGATPPRDDDNEDEDEEQED
jgi:DNA-binding transcriptional ArsR family regulator